jgi:hypothetical protein
MSVIMGGCQETEIQKNHLLHVPDVRMPTRTEMFENNTEAGSNESYGFCQVYRLISHDYVPVIWRRINPIG